MSADIQKWQDRMSEGVLRHHEKKNNSTAAEDAMAEEIDDLRAELARRDAETGEPTAWEVTYDNFDRDIFTDHKKALSHAAELRRNGWLNVEVHGLARPAVVSEGQAVAAIPILLGKALIDLRNNCQDDFLVKQVSAPIERVIALLHPVTPAPKPCASCNGAGVIGTPGMRCPDCEMRKVMDEAIKACAPAPEARDAQRYRRLRILGAAPGGHPCLDRGTVLCFQTLDAYLDADIAAYPSRGESKAAPEAPTAAQAHDSDCWQNFKHSDDPSTHCDCSMSAMHIGAPTAAQAPEVAYPLEPLGYITKRGALYGGNGGDPTKGDRPLFLSAAVYMLPDYQSVDGYKTDFNKGFSEGWNACRDKIVEINLATQPKAAPVAEAPSEDTKRLNWLDEQIVDVIYLDDGRIIDVRGYAVRPAIDAKLAAPATEQAKPILAKHAKQDDFTQSTVIGYAQFLAWAIWRGHYKVDSPDFEIMADALGVLSQIDNMTCGWKAAAQASPAKPDLSDERIVEIMTENMDEFTRLPISLLVKAGRAILTAITKEQT